MFHRLPDPVTGTKPLNLCLVENLSITNDSERHGIKARAFNKCDWLTWTELTQSNIVSVKKSLRTVESNKKRKKKAKQLKRLQSYIHEEVSNYNFKLVSGRIDNSGTISKNSFWKIRKKLFPKSQSVPHAVLDKLGNDVTDPQKIILAYCNEMFHRLQKRFIRANLKDYESAMNQLCRHRLHKARTTHSPLREIRSWVFLIQEIA